MLINWGSCKRFLICMSGALFLTGVMTVTEVAAQVSTGTILGTVADPSGAVVPAALVHVKNTGTGATQNAVTSAQGRYTVSDLPIGTYDVQVAMKGFQTVIHSGVALTVGSQTVVDFSLPVGQTEQTITVQGAAAQVETATSSMSNLIEQKQMVELPLNGRNFQQLMTLAPGVSVAQGVNSNFYGKGDTYTIAGGRPEGQAFLLDGTDITNFFNHGTGSGVLGTSLGIDAIAEFQVLTNTYSAQFGGSGSVMNAVSKSGTNQFHGSAFEFLRNSALDARNYFDGAKVPPFRRNQFGGTLGGPIKKDKAFFFFNYEGLRSALSTTQTAYVPDANARNGMLPCSAFPSPPFVLPPTCVDAPPTTLVNVGVNPNVAAALALYPATLRTDPTGIVGVPQIAGDAGHENYILGRVDYVFSEKDSLFGRVVSDRADYTNPYPYANIPLWPDLEKSPNLYLTAEERHIFSANVINALRGSYVRTDNNAVTLESHPGMNFFPGSGRPDGALDVAGLSNTGAQSLDPYRIVQNKFGVGDDLYWTKGAHTLKFGFALQRIQTLEYGPYLIGGLYIFNGITPAFDFATGTGLIPPLQAFLQDQPFLFVGVPLGQDSSYHWYHEIAFAPYVNDDWKVTSKLTLNLGLRYPFNTNPLCVTHDCRTLVHPLTDTTYTLVDHPFAQNPATRNFDPRIGFAYDPFQDHKTSIRGGFGIFHNVIAGRQWTAMFATNPPFVISSRVLPCFPDPFASCGFPGSAAPTGIVATDYSTHTTPYQMEWNLNVQREVFSNTILTVGYVGARGVHLIVQRDLNPPTVTIDAQGVKHFSGPSGENPRLNPNVNAYNAGVADGNSSYHSLQVNLNHRFSHHVQAQAAYTYSRCIDTASGTSGLENGGQPIEDPYNQAIDRGPCAFDITHALRINTVVSLPFHGNRLVEGWQVSGILSATSGPPFSPFVGFDSAGYFNQGSIYPMERPNMAAGRTCNNSLVTGNPNHWFDLAAFTVPDPGTFGNAPRNCMRAPGLFNADFSVSKETKMSEGFRIQFRAEFFNVFNHTNLQQPIIAGGGGGSPYNLIFNNPGAGVITATSTTSRQIQFGIKLLF